MGRLYVANHGALQAMHLFGSFRCGLCLSSSETHEGKTLNVTTALYRRLLNVLRPHVSPLCSHGELSLHPSVYGGRQGKVGFAEVALI